ncbi:MAG: DUF885 domain-containing protein [Thermoguttaceae bacterium]
MRKKFLSVVFVFVALFTLKAAEPNAEFEKLGLKYVDEFPAFSPVGATWLGDHRFDSKLDEVSEEARAAEMAFLKKYLAELEKINPTQLSLQNQIDYEMLKHRLEAGMFYLAELKNWESDPIIYTGLPGSAVYNIMARDFAPVKKRLMHVADRLEQFPRLFSQIRKTLKPELVSPVQADAAVKQNRGVISIIDDTVKPQLDKLSAADRKRLENAIKIAEESVEEHQKWIEDVLVPNAKADFRLGEKLYDKKLYYSLGTPITKEEVKRLAEEKIAETREEMYEISKTVYSKEYPGTKFPENPTPEYKQAIIRAALEVAYRDVPNPEDVVKVANESLKYATDFVREKDLITIPPDPVEIIVMPEFQRGVSIAYCDSPGALDVGQKTFYAVSPIPADWSEEQIRSFLREYNLRSIHELTIHEAMPGHYLQLAHSNRYPGKLRSVLESGTFIEGWAIYSEKMMNEQGYMNDDPLMKLINLKWDLRSMTNALIDQGIHAGNMSREEAMHMMTELGFQEEREAALKWIRALLTSAQLSTYFVGEVEMIQLRRDYEAKLGKDFDLKKYHDKVLSFGSPLPSSARKIMFQDTH